jgi:hypothetical protein
MFRTFCRVHCLKTETSPTKVHKFKEVVRFVGKETFKLEFEFKNFYIVHKLHVLLHIKI